MILIFKYKPNKKNNDVIMMKITRDPLKEEDDD